MEDNSIFITCITICICFGFILSIIGTSILGSYFDIYHSTQIKITNINYSSDNMTIYSFNPLETFRCVSNILRTTTCRTKIISDKIDLTSVSYSVCPNNFTVNTIYNYYCNCNRNICSFNQLYYYYNLGSFYMAVSGISLSILLLICLLLCCIIKKITRKEIYFEEIEIVNN
jgi:hypothetical protein